MKKIILFLLTALTFNFIAQDLKENKKLDEMYSKVLMLNLYNSDKKEEALKIAEEILSHNYGELDLNRNIHLYSIMPSLYISNSKFKEAYDFSLMVLKYLQLNRKSLLEESNLSVEKYNETIDKYVLIANSLVKEVDSLKDYAIITGDDYQIGKFPQNKSNVKPDLAVKESKTTNVDEKTVTLIVCGQGKTQEEAKQNALRSAIEQAFGAFISSKTEILNDEIVSDQITSVSSGNIVSYKILNEAQIPTGGFASTINAVVSVNKLTSFVQAKGVSVEIKGGLFALNIKQQLLNEQAELNAVCDMIGVIHEVMQTAFNYTIKSWEPKSLDSESKKWAIPILVKASCNKNIDFCSDYINKTLSLLSMKSSEIESYNSLNKKTFSVQLDNTTSIYLRKQSSLNAIKHFLSNWGFYIRLFKVDNGINQFYGFGNSKIQELEGEGSVNNYESISFLLPKPNEVVGSFFWDDQVTLEQIEKISEYSVKPLGTISKFKFGGYVVYEKNGHGLVTAPFDFLTESVNNGHLRASADLVLNGYSDWFDSSEIKENSTGVYSAKNEYTFDKEKNDLVMEFFAKNRAYRAKEGYSRWQFQWSFWSSQESKMDVKVKYPWKQVNGIDYNNSSNFGFFCGSYTGYGGSFRPMRSF